MENPTDITASEKIDFFEIIQSGLRFVYYKSGDQLYGGNLLPHGHAACADNACMEVDGITACRPFELVLTGEGPNFAARSRSVGGCANLMRFVGETREDRNDGVLITLEFVRDEPSLCVRQHMLFPHGNISVCRQWASIKNTSSKTVGLEQLSSATLHHIGLSADGRHYDDLRLHIPFSGWSGEAQWREFSPDMLGLTSPDSSHYRALSSGSRASAEKNPMAVLCDKRLGVSWFWQIEHSGSWMWEIGNLFYKKHHGLYWLAGGPSEAFGGWWMELEPGEMFETIPVAVGCVCGGFEDAVGALTDYRRVACRRPHPVDDKLPVIFNDYMNCLWGNPTLERELPLIRIAAKLGCEIFAMDSGWYAEPGENWWAGVGEWEVNKKRFPGDTFARVMREIRDHGMTPGIWLEPEVIGVHSPMADKPDSWFLKRHGRRVIYNGRMFLDFRSIEVREWLLEVNSRLINEYTIGYIKYDYNIDLMQGVDSLCGSLGQGLLEQTRALYDFYDALSSRFPHLIMENCGAGGLRMDYGLLSRMQIQSSSDLENFMDYAPLAAGVASVCLPEQMAVWAFPSAPGEAEDTICNMVNCLLGRVHLSGRIDQLNDESLALVREALDLYKIIRNDLTTMRPFYPMGMPRIACADKWMAWGLRNDSQCYLGVWRRKDSNPCYDIVLPVEMRTWTAEIIYPHSEDYGGMLTRTDEGNLRMETTSPISARFIKLSKNR